jgi:hypothetical protein
LSALESTIHGCTHAPMLMRSFLLADLSRLLCVSMLAVALPSCAASGGEVPKEGAIDKPRASNGFVPNAQVAGWVLAEARYETDFKVTRRDGRVVPIDLLDKTRVVQIWLKLGDRSRAQDELDVELTPEQMEFRLTLPDGSVLDAIPAEAVAKDDKEITTAALARALQPGFLKLSGGMKEGSVYFKVPKSGFEVDGKKLVHAVDGIEREIDLSRSLLSFKLRRGGLATPFYIGVAR